jgi:lipopolysaccharide transport system permease protein
MKNPDSLVSTVDSPLVRIEPSHGWVSLKLSEIWEYRELLYFLVWRDVKVRYKQTVIGAAWAIIQPFMTMMIFTVIFSHLAKVPSDGFPYPIFAYTALLPWTYFAAALSRAISSVIGDAHLVTKIYFPRLIMPLSGVLSPMVDFAFAFLVLLGMMVWFRVAPTWGVLTLPIFLLLALSTALAVGLWLSALNVRYRDVGHTIPFLVQIWMFASPIAYPVSMVPEKWRLLYSLNPMAGVIEGFRWALLGKESPDFAVMAVSAAAVAVLLWGGLLFFKRMERTFADVV